MASQPTVEWHEIERILGARPGAQVPFAQYIVNHGPLQGSVLSVAPYGQRAVDQLRPRAQARQTLPNRVAELVDRVPEQRLMREALAEGRVVEVYGPAGIGKTTLLSEALHVQLAGDYPAGAIYLTVSHDTAEDVLQEVVERFFEAEERHVKVTETEVRRLMAGKKGLIVLDDVNHLARGEAEAFAQAVPEAGIIIAGLERQVRQSRAVALGGLPDEEALTLFERHLGHSLEDEKPLAVAICRALGGVPQPIVTVARTARLRRVPLAQVLHEVRPQTPSSQPEEQMLWMLRQHLSSGERQVLAALAASGGQSVSRAAAEYLSGLAPVEVAEYLLRLEKLDLVHVAGDRLSLDDGLRLELRRMGVEDGTLYRAASYFLQQAGTLRARYRHPDEENVIAALEYFRERGRWREVLAIVYDMEAYLVSSARWGQWRKRLEDAWRAGRELGDPRTEAWAQNQLAIAALAAGKLREAIQLFRGALRIWRAIDDQTGATIARWNLQILLGPRPENQEATPEPADSRSKSSALRAILAIMPGIAATLLIILVALFLQADNGAIAPAAAVANWSAGSPAAGNGDILSDRELSPIATVHAPPAASIPTSPMATVPTSPTASVPVTPAPRASRPYAVPTSGPGPAPTASPPPALDIWLVEGCDRLYQPGKPVEVRARANLAGIVDLYVRDAIGQRHHLLRVELPAGGVTRGRYVVPDGEGSWRLEAELDEGRATASCSFAVAPQTG